MMANEIRCEWQEFYNAPTSKSNLLKQEMIALKDLSKDSTIVILSGDKGDANVMSAADYYQKI